MVFSGLSPRETVEIFLSCHSPSPASVLAPSWTFSQKQQIRTICSIYASIQRFIG
jgi:hypothetical protein